MDGPRGVEPWLPDRCRLRRMGAMLGMADRYGYRRRSIGHRLAYAFGPRARMTAGWQDGHYRCQLSLPLP